jgi:hypothetical protein
MYMVLMIRQLQCLLVVVFVSYLFILPITICIYIIISSIINNILFIIIIITITKSMLSICKHNIIYKYIYLPIFHHICNDIFYMMYSLYVVLCRGLVCFNKIIFRNVFKLRTEVLFII